jgi:K+-transporting ATPase ATPase A chain
MASFDYLYIILFLAALVAGSLLFAGLFQLAAEGPKADWLKKADSLLIKALVGRAEGMDWKQYSQAVFVFHGVLIAVVILIQMIQHLLPLNPAGLAGLSWHLALNTAVSFVTNTNWQSYSGEAVMSHFTQMIALGVQNFISASVGCAVLFALIRGIRSKGSEDLGNFYADVTRVTAYVFLPVALVMAVFLVSHGVPQTFQGSISATSLEGAELAIPTGPVASQVAIKQLGTNGGGYYGVNSAHPLENPTGLSNFFELLAILVLPGALVFTFGRMLKARKEAITLFCVMLAALLGFIAVSLYYEHRAYGALPLPNLEGKEARFGVTPSVLWSVATTAASNGSVNSMHSSLSPISGLLALANMMTGEVIFGGVGSGLYGMLLYAITTVFLAGLMIGRTPEYHGKKIQALHMRYVIAGILIPSALMLIFPAISVLIEPGLAGRLNMGPHGLTEILYAYTSAAGNNGSAFAGLTANTPYYNSTLAAGMFFGRLGVILPVLALAGIFAVQKQGAQTGAEFPTHGILFAVLLLFTIALIGLLTFFPALVLGPVLEHLLYLRGVTF